MAEHSAHTPPVRPRSAVIVALGVSQTLAWASSYYLPAILANPIANELGFSRAWVFAAFSMSLLIAALAGPRVGRLIDRRGGRGVLVLSTQCTGLGGVPLYMGGGVRQCANATGIGRRRPNAVGRSRLRPRGPVWLNILHIRRRCGHDRR